MYYSISTVILLLNHLLPHRKELKSWNISSLCLYETFPHRIVTEQYSSKSTFTVLDYSADSGRVQLNKRNKNADLSLNHRMYRSDKHHVSGLSNMSAASLRWNQNQNQYEHLSLSAGDLCGPTGTWFWFWILGLVTDSPAESRAGGNASCRGFSVIPSGWRRRRRRRKRSVHHGC